MQKLVATYGVERVLAMVELHFSEKHKKSEGRGERDGWDIFGFTVCSASLIASVAARNGNGHAANGAAHGDEPYCQQDDFGRWHVYLRGAEYDPGHRGYKDKADCQNEMDAIIRNQRELAATRKATTNGHAP